MLNLTEPLLNVAEFQMNKSLLFKFLSIILLSIQSPLIWAQTGPIKIIVGYPPGATSDLLTRILAEAMSKNLNLPVFLEAELALLAS